MTPFGDDIHRPARLGDGPDRAVVIHGFGGSPADARAIGESLAGRGWRVHLPALPGFARDFDNLGRTSSSTWREAVARELRSAARAARLRGARVLAIGFSMGGTLVLSSLADEADIDGAVLIAPFTRFADPRAALLPVARMIVRHYRPYATADFRRPHVRDHVRRKIGSIDLDDPLVRSRLRREVCVPLRALDELRRLGRRAWSVAPCVPRVPLLVVQGERDRTVLAAHTRGLVARLPTAPETAYLPDADHHLVLAGRPGHEETLTAIAHFAATVRGDFGDRGLRARWRAYARRTR
jgi:carboxylesterase